ncbi:MAG: YceI family protein [Candidatus Binataceae bacterium]
MRSWFVAALVFCAVFAAAPQAARADVWKIDPPHTSVGFSVRHMMVSHVRGQFRKVSGTIAIDGKNPATFKADVTIDAASIDTGVPARDEELKSEDFLDVAKYPLIFFKSITLAAAGPGKWKLTGNLTIRGVTRSVTLDVDGPAGPIKDPSGHLRAGASASAAIKRRDFGIVWNHAIGSGGVLVGGQVLISIDLEAVKQ